MFPLILMGFSLCAKHILMFFPIWWAIKEKRFVNKILIILIPYSIFMLSFASYLPTDFEDMYPFLPRHELNSNYLD